MVGPTLRAALAFPLERIAQSFLAADPDADFSTPRREAAIVPPDSVSWQVFRNPVSMFVGGIAAVLLELGEPRVRTAVWEHSSFRTDPAGRLRRTGLAAMITVYGARSRFEATAGRVRAMHRAISGTTPAGQPYRADDPELLRWVQGTAAFAFLAAYRTYVRPVAAADQDRYYTEGRLGSSLYGVDDPPASESAIAAMIAAMRPQLEPSPILDELIALLRTAAILPKPLQRLQHIAVRAAVDILPVTIRDDLRLERHGRLSLAEGAVLRAAALAMDRVTIRSSPAAQACLRLGLPADYLLRTSSVVSGAASNGR